MDRYVMSGRTHTHTHTQSGQMDAPLLLWLQGGPGGSSLFGLFNENGPLYVDQGGQGE